MASGPALDGSLGGDLQVAEEFVVLADEAGSSVTGSGYTTSISVGPVRRARGKDLRIRRERLRATSTPAPIVDDQLE